MKALPTVFLRLVEQFIIGMYLAHSALDISPFMAARLLSGCWHTQDHSFAPTHLSAIDRKASLFKDSRNFRSRFTGSRQVTSTIVDSMLYVLGRAVLFRPRVLLGQGDVQDLAKGVQALRWKYLGTASALRMP